MEFAAGALHWSEPVFWTTSLRYFDRAVRGYRRANGIDDGPSGMTRARLEELKALYPD